MVNSSMRELNLFVAVDHVCRCWSLFYLFVCLHSLILVCGNKMRPLNLWWTLHPLQLISVIFWFSTFLWSYESSVLLPLHWLHQKMQLCCNWICSLLFIKIVSKNHLLWSKLHFLFHLEQIKKNCSCAEETSFTCYNAHQLHTVTYCLNLCLVKGSNCSP